MRFDLVITAILALAIGSTTPATAAVKKVAYPEVKVQVAERYQPNAAFETMRKAFAEAVAKKDANAVFALVGPTFVWTLQGGPIDDFDLGRDALHNFKVVFGFRTVGADSDGGVENGPFWDSLAEFADDGTYYVASSTGNLVCGPALADVAAPQMLEQARKKIETADEPASWYFTLSDTVVIRTPGDTGAPVARVSTIAVPVVELHPPVVEGQPPQPVSHLEVLLPSGRSGWIPVSAARPLDTDRLCYARTPSGEWKIAAFDQSS